MLREERQKHLTKLLQKIDFEETFMQGHAVGGALEPRHQKRLAEATPTWALNNEQVQALLRKVFPKMDSDPGQHERAAKWASIIYEYFRYSLSAGAIANEICRDADKLSRMDKKEFDACVERQRKLVKKTIYRIKKAAAGFRTTGKPRTRKPKKQRPRTGRPRGRPKKEQV